jgi:hypothetical protein
LWNESQEEAHALVEYRPALRMETLFETLFGLGRDGKTDEEGSPRLLQGVVILEEYEDEYRLVRPPRPVQEALLAVLAPIGRLLGYRGHYPQYSPPKSPAVCSSALVGAGATSRPGFRSGARMRPPPRRTS